MSSSRSAESTSTETGEPLRVNAIEIAVTTPSLRTPQSEIRNRHQALRGQWDRARVRPRRRSDRVEDGWRGPVDRQLAQALRALRSMRIGVLEKRHMDRRDVVAPGGEIIGQMGVDHRPIAELALLHYRPTDALHPPTPDLPARQGLVQHLAHLLHGDEAGHARGVGREG